MTIPLLLLMALALVVSVVGLALIFGGAERKATSFALPTLKAVGGRPMLQGMKSSELDDMFHDAWSTPSYMNNSIGNICRDD